MFPAIPSLQVRRTLFICLSLLAAAFFLSTFAASAAPALQNSACQTAPIAADPSASVCISRVIVPFNGVSPENQFYVSWRSQSPERGQVKLSSGEIFDDVRGADYQGITHYVMVDNLDAKKNYSLDVISGGQTFTNNGAHWSLKTGPALQSTNPYIILGRVKNSDGSDADNVVVFAQLRDGDNQGTQGRSAYLSALVVLADGGNYFTIDVDQARTQNLAQKYVFNPETDRVQIIAVGAQGTATQVFKLSDLHPPAPAPSLSLSSSGSGTAATATPTPIPPTNTPTFTPSPTATETPTAPTPTETPLAPTRVPPTDAVVVPTEQPSPTLAPTQETATAETPTLVAIPAGEEVEPQHTRVFGGVPTVVPPPPPANNNALFIVLALVLFIGALLLGAAAFFASRR